MWRGVTFFIACPAHLSWMYAQSVRLGDENGWARYTAALLCVLILVGFFLSYWTPKSGKTCSTVSSAAFEWPARYFRTNCLTSALLARTMAAGVVGHKAGISPKFGGSLEAWNWHYLAEVMYLIPKSYRTCGFVGCHWAEWHKIWASFCTGYLNAGGLGVKVGDFAATISFRNEGVTIGIVTKQAISISQEILTTC